jgi:hypothetical protein
MSSLHQDLPFDRHHLLMLKVASGELVNEISVLLTSLTDNNREHHIFPKHICQRILLKINSILRPSLDAIHSHHTYPMTGSYMDKPTLKVLTSTHNLRQNLIIIKGNMETVENQFYTDTLLSMVKELDPYFPDRYDLITEALKIAKDNSEKIHLTTTNLLSRYDKSMLQVI